MMSGNTPGYIILSLIIATVAGFIILFVLRKMKGSLKVTMDRTAFDSGTDIKGRISLTIRKETFGNRLTVALVAREITTRHEEKKQTTHTREVYRDEYELEGSKTYTSGHTSSHHFKLTIPAMNRPEGPNAAFSRNAGDHQTRVEWAVESRLDARGVDLVAKNIISVR